jgi:hypothetical protein
VTHHAGEAIELRLAEGVEGLGQGAVLVHVNLQGILLRFLDDGLLPISH